MEKEYGAKVLKDLIMQENDLFNYTRSILLSKPLRAEALKLLLNDEDAVNKFGRQNILEAAKVANIALEDKGQQPSDQGNDASKLPTMESIIEKIKAGELGSNEYTVSNPPKGGNPVTITQENINKLRAGV